MSKFSNIFKIASQVAKPFVPGAAGLVLSEVTDRLNSDGNQAFGKTPDAIKTLAADNDEQTQAILAMGHIIDDLQARLAALESK